MAVAYEELSPRREGVVLPILKKGKIKFTLGKIIGTYEGTDDPHPQICIRYEDVKRVGRRIFDNTGGEITNDATLGLRMDWRFEPNLK